MPGIQIPPSKVTFMADFSLLVEQDCALAKDLLNGPDELQAALSQPVTELLARTAKDAPRFKTRLHPEVREDGGTTDA